MMSTQMDRIERMLEALCEHLGVPNGSPTQISSDVRVEAKEAGAAAAGNGRRYGGVVSRFDHGWGFIECQELGRNFFVHYSDIEGTGLRSLQPDEQVTFETGPGRDGRPKAVRVRRQDTNKATPESNERQAISSHATSGEDTSSTEAEKAGDEEDDMLQPESSMGGAQRLSQRNMTRRARAGGLLGRRPAISW